MGWHDLQQVCLKGHQITDRYNGSPSFRKSFCPQCGEKTIAACPACQQPIKGHYEVEGVIDLTGRRADVPTHCDSCGTALPWSAQLDERDSTPADLPWSLLHPEVVSVARSRFESGHYADGVEAALKRVNSLVKRAWVEAGKTEKDGSDLMFAAFDLNAPVVRLAAGTSMSERSAQEGYKHIFAGTMMAVRNPKAHDNVEINRDQGFRFLALASLLMEKLEEAGCLTRG